MRKKRKKRIRRLGVGGKKVKADGTTTATKVKKNQCLLFNLVADFNGNRIDPTKTFRRHRFRIR